MQARFSNDNNKKGFDLGSAWRDIKTAYIFNLVIVLGLISTMVYFMFVAGPSCNELQHEARKEGEESGFIAGSKSGYEKAQKDIILRLLLAGIIDTDILTLTDGNSFVVDKIKDELETMSDKQIIELKNIRLTRLNWLREMAKKYNPNKEEAKEHQLYLDGIIEGRERRQKEIAVNMLLAGLHNSIIYTLTKVGSLNNIKNETENMTDKQLEDYLADDTWEKRFGRYRGFHKDNIIRIDDIEKVRKLSLINRIEDWKKITDEKNSTGKK